MHTFKASGFKLYKNLSFKSEVKEVLIEYEQIMPKRHSKYAHSDSSESFYFWEMLDLPKDKGVYLVYDCDDICIYVGSTPKREDGGIRKRFKEHLSGKFARYGFKVYCYIPKKPIANNILLLERAFIAALDPVFNNDEPNKERLDLYINEQGVCFRRWYGGYLRHIL
ncbi:hypothetical protein ASG99_12375 [Bacillus sp. Soil768D1]|nr:hypothetical protein ASG99_12375 [Bacillus sp. Soil768D1]